MSLTYLQRTKLKAALKYFAAKKNKTEKVSHVLSKKKTAKAEYQDHLFYHQ